MSRFFKRSIRVIIDDGSGTGLKIDTLKIAIDLHHRISSKSTEGTVRIFNLNKSTETKIRERGRRVQVFIAYDTGYFSVVNGVIRIVGNESDYESRLQLIHDGQIRRIKRSAEGLNRVTHLEVLGRYIERKAAVSSLSYSAPVSPQRVVKDTVSDWSGLTFLNAEIIPNTETLIDFAWSGPTRELYDRILKPLNIQYVERNGLIEFSLIGEPISNDVIVLSKDSGMIASPEVTEQGINVKSMANPKLIPGVLVQVISAVLPDGASGTDQKAGDAEAVGTYKIVDSRHRGDNWDGDFITTIECVPVGATRDAFPLLSGVS